MLEFEKVCDYGVKFMVIVLKLFLYKWFEKSYILGKVNVYEDND